MNSQRSKDCHDRAWLKVDIISQENNRYIVQSELFDGTPFTFTVHDHEIEIREGEVPPLVQVGLNGENGVFAEIVLPKPDINFGHIVRVKETSLVKTSFYNKMIRK